MGRDTATMSLGIRGHCIGASYAYVLETDIVRPWQLICVLILVTAMFVLLFSFTALVFTMCLVTVSDIGIVIVYVVTPFPLFDVHTGYVKRVEMSIWFKTCKIYPFFR